MIHIRQKDYTKTTLFIRRSNKEKQNGSEKVRIKSNKPRERKRGGSHDLRQRQHCGEANRLLKYHMPGVHFWPVRVPIVALCVFNERTASLELESESRNSERMLDREGNAGAGSLFITRC